MNSKRISSRSTARPQRGAALATTLVFLTILTMIGLSAMNVNRQEQRMSTNIQELNHAFQYAESGLVTGLQSPDLLNTAFVTSASVDWTSPQRWLCANAGDPSIEEDCTDGSSAGNAAIFNYYRGAGKLPPKNYSIDSGVTSHYFYVLSRGKTQKSRSIHDMGVSIVGPSGAE